MSYALLKTIHLMNISTESTWTDFLTFNVDYNFRENILAIHHQEPVQNNIVAGFRNLIKASLWMLSNVALEPVYPDRQVINADN